MPEKDQRRLNIKRKFVERGIFYAEINEFLARELADAGYAGCNVNMTPHATEIVIDSTRYRDVLGANAHRIRELISIFEKRFNFPEGTVHASVREVKQRSLCAEAQAESIRFKLLNGSNFRRVAYGAVNSIMRSDALGCEVIISGKVRAQRAKVMKFQQGYILKTGQPNRTFVTQGIRHVMLRQGVLGIKVIIMHRKPPGLPHHVECPAPDHISYQPSKDIDASEEFSVEFPAEARTDETQEVQE